MKLTLDSARSLRDRVAAATNPYEVLGLPPAFTPQQLRDNYAELARALHPDRNPDDAEAAALMARANVARDRLADSQKRKVLDGVLHIERLRCQSCAGVGYVRKYSLGAHSECSLPCTLCSATGWAPKGGAA